jgi:protein-tyrosine phosphatase
MPEERPSDRVLLLCTANRCRSVMAGAFLGHRLGVAEAAIEVCSAGVAGSGLEPAAEVVSVMGGYGLDVSGHRSHQVTVADLDAAQLILGLAREHVRHAAVTAPDSWPRAFTLKEIVRRGTEIRARLPGEPLPEWLAALHAGRDRRALLGDGPADDVADPIGGPPPAYAAAAAELDHLVGLLARLGWGLPAAAGGRRMA